MSNTLLNEAQTAEVLNVSPATLRRWRWAGKGPQFRKIGGAVRYSPGDIDAYVEASLRSSTTCQEG